MRMRYMELPSQVIGDVCETPFILVIDRCSEDDLRRFNRDTCRQMSEETGARAVSVFASEVSLSQDEGAFTHQDFTPRRDLTREARV